MDMTQKVYSSLGTENLWAAVRDLAITWRDVALVRDFTKPLPRNLGKSQTDHSKLIQNIFVAGAPSGGQPLLIYSDLPYSVNLPFGPDLSLLRTKYSWWLETAERVNAALHMTLGWLRSRLPGYPLIPAPQLTEHTPLKTPEFSFNVIWTKEERRLGLQLRDVPDALSETMQTDPTTASRIIKGTREFARALQRSTEWRGLDTASSDLSSADKDSLLRCRKRIKEALQPSKVDRYEPHAALARDQYRRHIVHSEISNLRGPAKQYAEAFYNANALLELAAVTIFSQLVCYELVELSALKLEVSPERETTLTLSRSSAASHGHVDPGTVAWIDHPLLDDAILVTRVRNHSDVGKDFVSELSGRVLEGSAEAWKSTNRENR